MNHETALRDALHELTLDQPTAPADRFAAVRRRHIRRRTQLAAAAAVVAAVAGGGAIVLGTTIGDDSTQPLHRTVPSWALPWPDHRDGSVSQQTLDQAVSQWRHFPADDSVGVLPKPTSITWYVAQRAVDNDQVVVVFEADSVEGHRLVAGFASLEGIRGQAHGLFAAGSSPWVLYDVPAPPPSFRGIIGLNVPQNGAVTREALHNWIVVLTRPGVRQVGWTGSGVDGGTAPTDRGLVIADTGRPTGQVFASVSENPHQISVVGTPLPVRVPGAPKSAAPTLRVPGPLDGVPTDLPSFGEVAGQGSVGGGDESMKGVGRTTTIYARCYGGPSIRVAIDTLDSHHGVSVQCDGQQHVVTGGRLLPHSPFGKGHGFHLTASGFTAWRVAIVVN